MGNPILVYNPFTGVLDYTGQVGGSEVFSVNGTNGVTASPTTGNVIVSGVLATTSSVGVASYNPNDFTVSSGVVSLKGERGFVWNSVTSSSPTNPIQIVAENGYICNGVSQVTFILPLAPAVGDSFTIISNTATFQVTENASQQMCIGTSASTAGSGNLTSNGTGDQIEFVYMGGNIFRGFAPQGTFTLN